MKSNARCLMPPAAAPLIATLWLSACATVASEAKSLCPPVVKYTTADQVSAANEVGELPIGAMIIRMLVDYAVLRDQARACR